MIESSDMNFVRESNVLITVLDRSREKEEKGDLMDAEIPCSSRSLDESFPCFESEFVG